METTTLPVVYPEMSGDTHVIIESETRVQGCVQSVSGYMIGGCEGVM